MKSILPSIILLATLGMAQAQFTTLIGPGVRNGDFNDDTSATDQRTFAQTPFWENIAGAQSANATRTNLDVDGTRNLLLTHAATVIPGQDTGHTIATGDVFSVSYEWRDASNWNDGIDKVRVILFTTSDDTIGGTRTTIASTDSPVSTLNSTYEFVEALDFYTALPGDVGKKLFVGIETVDAAANGGFARLDEFFLEVGTSTIDPVLAIDTGDYAFGELFHLTGSSTTVRTVTFANAGASNDLTLDSISLTNDGGGVFSITDAPTGGTVIPAGATFDVEITATGGGGYTNYVGELLIDTTPNDQDTTVPVTATISTSGDPLNLLYVENPDMNEFTAGTPPEDGGVAIWNGFSVPTAGLKSTNGARLKGTGDPSTDPLRGDFLHDNLAQNFKGEIFPDFRATICFAIPEFSSWVGSAPSASNPDRSFHLAILGTTTLTAGGDYDDVQTADAIIDLFYLPAGTTADPNAGFFLYDGVLGAFTRLPALGTLLESTGFTTDGEPPTSLNTYQLTITGDDFGSAGASYEIAISGANTTTAAASVSGLTTYHGIDPATATAKAIVLTTADASTATGDSDLVNPTIAQPSFWVDQVQVGVPATLPIAAWDLEDAPGVVKTLGSEVLTTTFTVGNKGIGADLTVDTPVFGDPRFSLVSPTLPVSIAPGATQVFEVQVDLSNDSVTQNIPTTLTLTTNDFLMATRVLDLEGQVLATGERLLVDYDDGLANGIHEASLRNGGFEDGTAGQTFVETPVWTSAFSPEGDGTICTLDASPATGSLYGQATGFSGGGSRAQANQIFSFSDWTLQEGDTFTVSFAAQAGTGWDGSGPQVIIEVLDADGNFVSDPVNNAGSADWRWAAPAFTFAGDGSAYERFTFTTPEIQPGSPWIGNRVQVRILKGGTRLSFINVDDVTITANMKLPVTADLEVTAIAFDPNTKDVTIRFVDTGAATYTIESDADFDFGAGVTDYALDGSEDTTTYSGEIEFTFNDPTVTGTSHSWRVRAD